MYGDDVAKAQGLLAECLQRDRDGDRFGCVENILYAHAHLSQALVDLVSPEVFVLRKEPTE